jgi:hypothetical protein
MADKVGIKCVDNVYIIAKGKKYNMYVIAITEDDRKIGSSVYVTLDDLNTLYNAFIASNVYTLTKCDLSSGTFSIAKERLPFESNLIDVYKVTFCNGTFVSRMSTRAYTAFLDSIKACHKELEDGTDNPYRINESIFPGKKKKNNIIKFPKLFRRKPKKGIFE